MDDTTRWIIGGIACAMATGFGYFLVRLDGDVRYLMKSVIRIEAYQKADKRRPKPRPRARRVKP